MRRVASLYLPQFAIERLRRLERPRVPLEAAQRFDLPIDADPESCSVPRSGGWRPGARWARDHGIKQIAPSAVPTEAAFAPLILAEQSGQTQRVAAACPMALALRLHPGMAVTQARALVPNLDVRSVDRQADARLLDQFTLHAIHHWTPTAAPNGNDGLWLDLTGVAHLHGGEERFCQRLQGFFRRLGFTLRVAIAGTPGAAHALARFGRGPVQVIAPGAEAQAIAPLPLAALRLTSDALGAATRFGLERIGDLLPMPRGPLARRLGLATVRRLDKALGRISEPIVPVIPEEVPTAERRLLEPICTAEAIAQVIADLLADLTTLLRERGLGVRALTLMLERIDGSTQHLSLGTARATRDPAHLARLFHLRLETIEPGSGIEIMRLTASRCEPLGATPLGQDLAGEDASADVATLIDQLAGRLGASGLFRVTRFESDVPERAVARTDPLAPSQGWPRWCRPVRLLLRPEPLTNVVALLPDHPPRRFSWRGTVHKVVAGDGPERIHGEWWRRDGEVWAVRDYFRVEDEHGARFWLFRRGDGADEATGDLSWYIHGLFG